MSRNKQKNTDKVKNIDSSKAGKTIGINIEQNQSNGEKIKIIADLMEEDQEKKLIKLIKPITKILKKNNITKLLQIMAI